MGAIVLWYNIIMYMQFFLLYVNYVYLDGVVSFLISV